MENVYWRRILILSVIIGVVLIAGLFLFDGLVSAAYRTTSPDGQYQASYNRLTRVITVRALNGDQKWLFGECEVPSLLWSPDSRYLAMNITRPGGDRYCELFDLEHSSGTPVPSRDRLMPEAASVDSRGIRTEVTKWLDKAHTLVEFQWPGGEGESTVSGWYIYELTSRTILELTFAR